MTLYTPPSLPHTPSYAMNATLPSLPIELVPAWSAWRPTKSQAPLTPPISAFPSRRGSQQTLPPIKQLEGRLSRVSPITPPQTDDGEQWHSYGPVAVRLPPVQSLSRDSSPMPMDTHHKEQQPSSPPKPTVVDWLTPSTHRSSEFLAEKTCEMICYLWFSTLSKHSSLSTQTQTTLIPEPNPATALLQFAVSPSFTRFMRKVLETTQVSQSVIVLALQYIYRLKTRNEVTHGRAGSEYRVAIAALMMANKFVDDNTYTNKTWSEVSGIELSEINRMEREFLLGIDFDLYVDKATYNKWLNLLKGLVSAKERQARHWRGSHRVRAPGRPHAHHTPAHASHTVVQSQRARSSSPARSGRSQSSIPHAISPVYNHYAAQTPQEYPTPPRSGYKRTAGDAFSPTSSTFPPIKAARRPSGLTLDIPELNTTSTASPLEPLSSFSKLSLGASPAGVRSAARSVSSPAWPSTRESAAPKTLVSAYRADDKPAQPPQNLYFYSLACSPTEDENRQRKARLRYHQPPATSADYGYSTQPTIPMVVQSASASPHEPHVHLSAKPPTLPHFSEVVWDRPRASVPIPQSYSQPIPPHGRSPLSQDPAKNGVPSAPFANAGPPGIQFYPSNVPPHSPEYYWSRGRRI